MGDQISSNRNPCGRNDPVGAIAAQHPMRETIKRGLPIRSPVPPPTIRCCSCASLPRRNGGNRTALQRSFGRFFSVSFMTRKTRRGPLKPAENRTIEGGPSRLSIVLEMS